MKVYFNPTEVAELIQPLYDRFGPDRLFGGDSSAIRAAWSVLNDPGERCELRRVDRIFSAMGRPDLMSLLEEL